MVVYIRWIARILAFVVMIGVLLFFLEGVTSTIKEFYDKGSLDFTYWYMWVFGFMLTVATVSGFILSWSRELIGGIIFITIGLVILFLLQVVRRIYGVTDESVMVILTIVLPFIIPGLLFIWYWYMKKKSIEKAKN